MKYKEINKIYENLIKLIEKETQWSEIWIGLIINLPSIIYDINTINSTNAHLLQEISFSLDRLSYGFGKNSSFSIAKEIIKKIFYKINKKNYFSPLLAYNKNVKVLVFDTALNNFKYRNWENKEDSGYHFTSVISFFGSKIKVNKKINNEQIDKIAIEILKIVSKNIDKRNLKKWNKTIQNKFKKKLCYSIKCAIIRFNYFEEKIPNSCQKVYLPTLYSPFNRIVALAMQKKEKIVNSFDHGSGTGNTSNWMLADIEYQLTNKFITFGEDFLTILKEFENKRKSLLKSEFKIIPSYESKKKFFIDKKNNSKIENIIYLTTITFSPNEHCFPDPLEIVNYTIFKINILKSISKLKKYKIYIKEHPDTIKNNYIQKDILKSLDVTSTQNNLDKFIANNNLFIIDYIQTSCLRFALENQIKTIILINDKTDTSEKIINEIRKYNFIEIINISSINIPIDHKLIMEKIKKLDAIKNFIFGNLY